LFLLLKAQLLIAVKSRKRKKKERNSEIKGTRIDRDHLTENGAKTSRSVAAFLCGAE